jgi:exopolysaccharide production protein ExoZ
VRGTARRAARRVSHTSEKLLGVEAGRGVAALLVVLLHGSDIIYKTHGVGVFPLHGLFRFGHAGVDFFFVLSGFIIHWVHCGDIGRPDRFGNFAWKRFVRIFPTYWVVLAAMYALLIVSPTVARTEQHVANILASVTLLPSTEEPAVGVAWTLRHELLFYSLFALLIFRRRLGIAVMALWWAATAAAMVVFLARGAPPLHGLAGQLLLRGFNLEFLFGIAVSMLLQRRADWRPAMLLAAGVTVFVGVGFLEDWGPPLPVEWPLRHLGYGIGAALALYGVVGVERRHGWRPPNWLTMLGAASYALYLTHVISVMIVMRLLRTMDLQVVLPPEVLLLVVAGVAVTVALIFNRVIERPLLAWVRGLRPVARA